jgi:uncharacterized protein (DUF486 family)
MKVIYTILLLIISNVFMTLAWYGHLKFKEFSWFAKLGLISVILISWGLALFEYVFQVPANKLGFKENGGPFSLIQLKVMQEVITLIVFTVFTFFFFREESIKWNHIAAFICLVMAVFFVFFGKNN